MKAVAQDCCWTRSARTLRSRISWRRSTAPRYQAMEGSQVGK
jgi:hypothetical protein